VGEWLYLLHAPRDDFAVTMTEPEQAIFGQHFSHLKQRFDDGKLVLAGPSLGTVNTGVSIFEADDEAEARAFVESDPAVSSGLCTGEVRPFQVSMLRGRD
jgi:uncharacterized protein YciI